jgi:hypothetical protein
MRSTDIAGRAERVAAVRSSPVAGAAEIEAALVATREVRAWADSQEAALISQLTSVTSTPEPIIAAAGKTSLNRAGKARERAQTLDATPFLADALANGAITADHVDAITRGSKQLDDEQRRQLFVRVDDLTAVAAEATIDEFADRIRVEVKKLQSGDGMDRLERQLSNVRVNSWTDAEGMWNIRGRFDPLTGVKLSERLRNTVNSLFAEEVPDLCPSDPVEKQKFLAAHALRRLLTGNVVGRATGRPEYIVVIDADAPGTDGPVAEWTLPVEIPPRALAELAPGADVHAVIVRNGVVLHAPGELNLGRTTRLANRAQRRALRALYASCGIPGCATKYDRCKLHHIVWWRNGGRTDLDNLLPVCAGHHANIHHDGWVATLGPHRELTVTMPDGTVRNTGPPNRRAA